MFLYDMEMVIIYYINLIGKSMLKTFILLIINN